AQLALAVLIIQRVISAILTGLHSRHPGSVLPVPVDGERQAIFEIHSRRPARLAHDLAARDPIPAVVSRAIFDKPDERVGGPSDRQDLAHNLDIRQRAVAAYVVDFALPALFENRLDGAAVVIHIEPVANL